MKPVITRTIGFATLGMTYVHTALADNILDGANSAQGSLPNTTLNGSSGFFSKITNILIYLVGAISVIMLIIGGLRYVMSQGDSAAVKQAKDTILYAIIGIVVAVLAYAIVHFVIGNLT